MRKGFTLIEVLVAASIIAFVGLGLLQTHSTNAKLIKRMDNQYSTKEEFSLVLLNADENYNGSTKSIYELIRKKFVIKDDDTIKYLKDKKLSYEQKELSNINLLETDLDSFISDIGDIDKSSLPDIVLVIDKVLASSDNGIATGYTIKLQ